MTSWLEEDIEWGFPERAVAGTRGPWRGDDPRSLFRLTIGMNARSESSLPDHKGCPLPDCKVDPRGFADCLERACPHCGARDLYENRCLVCGRTPIA